MGKAFGIWSLVLVGLLLWAGFSQLLPVEADPATKKAGRREHPWAGIVLIVLALAVFLVLWLFVSGRL